MLLRRALVDDTCSGKDLTRSTQAAMEAAEESLVMRRSRRSTAGNRWALSVIIWMCKRWAEVGDRMEAALAEFKAEDLGQDVEEDVDFVVQVGACSVVLRPVMCSQW